jgi:phytoene synthase
VAVSEPGTGESHPACAPGSDFYYASLYHPLELRDTLRALAALRAELVAIPVSCSDHGVAHVKLAWWHEELARTAGEPSRHALTRTLRPLFAHEPAWRATCLALVERLHDALSKTACADEGDLRASFAALHGRFAVQLAGLAEPHLELAADSLSELAIDTELLRAVLELRTRRRAGPLPFDRATLARHGLTPAHVQEATQTAGLGGLVADALVARRDRLAARVAVLSRPLRRRARLPITLARLVLRSADLTLADGAAVLERRVEATPLDKLLIAWRTRYVG